MMVEKLEAALEKKSSIPPLKPMLPPFNAQLGATLPNNSLQFQPMDPQRLNRILAGKLKNMGDAYIGAGQHYNINPALLAAISIHETGNGSSNAAQTKNNVAGMMGKDGLRSYESVEQSIWDMARNLSQNYLGQGINTIASIGAKYAPIGAENDPTQLNNDWVFGVSSFFNRLNRQT